MRKSSGGPDRPTIVDVAEAARVSVSTVSRVLRDHPDVRAETRQRVHQIIEKMGYRPSLLAQAMVSGQTKLIALLVSDISNPFYPQLAKSIEQEAKHDGYAVIICNTSDQVAESRCYIESLLRQGLDGIIHASVALDEETVMSLMGDPRRVVFTNRRPRGSAASFVVSDNRAGARKLAEHLLAQGHRRIGFIGGPEWATNATERLEGFIDALKAAPGTEPLVAAGPFSLEHGSRTVKAWLARPNPPTAVVAINDATALGALTALAHLGVSVPKDIAVAGFDGTDIASLPMLNLTTVDQRINQLGRLAVQTLVRQIKTAGDEHKPVHRVLSCPLIVRGSSVAKPPEHAFNSEPEVGTAVTQLNMSRDR